MERIFAGSNASRSLVAKVYRDTDTGEYVVKFYRDNVHQKDADYFTDDKKDAISTADHFTNELPAPLSKLEFAAIVTPLLTRNIAFDLGLTGCHMAWLTWNVGDDSISVIYHDGSTGTVGFPCEN